jgi:uncharacterized integral membrane protein
MAERDPLQPQAKGTNWRAWGLGFVALILVIFVAQNAQKVAVDFLFVHTDTPLIFALLVATLLGAVIGYVAPLVRKHRREA